MRIVERYVPLFRGKLPPPLAEVLLEMATREPTIVIASVRQTSTIGGAVRTERPYELRKGGQADRLDALRNDIMDENIKYITVGEIRRFEKSRPPKLSKGTRWPVT